MTVRRLPLTRPARRLIRDRRGAAAVEFALSLPLLVALLLGFLESGRYIEEVHIVTKAVRDGVRYAARQPFTSYACTTGMGAVDIGSTPIGTAIKRYVRTGSVTGTTPRLRQWTDDNSVSVLVVCNRSSTGLYEGVEGGAPVVQIHANVPYTPLAGEVGWHSGMALHSRAQSAVMGIAA